MVTVIFYNLLRSKYQIKEDTFQAGTIHDIVNQILAKYPQMEKSDFETSVVFYQGQPIHYGGFKKHIPEGERIIITHFVGGG